MSNATKKQTVEINLYCGGLNYGKGRFSTEIATESKINPTVSRMIRKYEAVMGPGCMVEVDGSPYMAEKAA